MKISSAILFYSSLAFLIIGVQQIFMNGWHNSYWLFMFSIICFFIYKLRSEKNKGKNPSNSSSSKGKKEVK